PSKSSAKKTVCDGERAIASTRGRVRSPELLAISVSYFPDEKIRYVFAPDEKNLLPSRARFYRVRRPSTGPLGRCRSKAKTSVGLLQRTGRGAVGKRWPAHDASERTALHRSQWRCLDRAGGSGCRWRFYPARALVVHGRPA